ncbi:hypothetical protein FHS89_002759 [Rubricella aquisinus]|uniref:CENP-V/GFA domain-containing protein n=1 Tax=Rubricella aquisinus TaxID=2028108 RepID=A0A840WNT3_9RHOB|nr:GFA family protein [Rubricella aquisinus]MBB5516719.1 hypothetical protein [Rubricella aquisinus]
MSAECGCACGAVHYTVAGPLRPVIACHCTQCRVSSGHHVAATAALREHITITGQVTWYESSTGVRRGFCGICGSNLFWETETSANMSIFAGTIRGKTGLTLAGHIFTADKGDYYEITDGLPTAAADDPNLTTQ